MVSTLFDPSRWNPIDKFDFHDITYHRAKDHGTVRIAFNRPEVRNAFRPQTVDELILALEHAHTLSDVGCVLVTGCSARRRRTVAGRFARVAINASAARTATSMPTAAAERPRPKKKCGSAGSTSSKCSG